MGGRTRLLSAALLAGTTCGCSVDRAPLEARGSEPRESVTPRAQKRSIEPLFAVDGVTLTRAGGRLRVSPTGLGCEGRSQPMGRATPPTPGPRVRYLRPEIEEWYVAGTTFVEQGFTMPAPPPCRRDGGVGVVVTLGEVLDASIDGAGRSARIVSAGTSSVLYCSKLHVTDADGRSLSASFIHDGRALAIGFDDAGARYPVEIDPTWQQQDELTGPPESGFGAALAADGDTLAIGAPLDANSEGSVFIYGRDTSGWSLQQTLKATSPIAGDSFGQSLAIAGDVLLVGAPGNAGYVYYFLDVGGTWTLSDQFAANFGTAIAIDGTTALVGGEPETVYGLTIGGSSLGSQSFIVDPSDGGADGFGQSVAIQGTTAVVGAPVGGSGSVYVFTLPPFTDDLATLDQTLATGGVGAGFGAHVALAGSTLVVSSVGASTTIFSRTGSTWSTAPTVLPSPPNAGPISLVGDLADGGTLAVAGVEADGRGVVQLFEGTTTGVMAGQAIQPADGQQGDGFGSPVVLTSSTLAAAATTNGTAVVYVFGFQGTAGEPCAKPTDCLTGFCVDDVCCQAASCSGAASECTAPTTCAAGTGLCTAKPSNEGLPCDGGTACGATATCFSGTCAAPASVCAPADDCHEFGSCDPSTDSCVNAPKPDGEVCSRGRCASGTCVPSGTGVASSGAVDGCGCRSVGEPRAGATAAAALEIGVLVLMVLATRGRRRASRHSRVGALRLSVARLPREPSRSYSFSRD